MVPNVHEAIYVLRILIEISPLRNLLRSRQFLGRPTRVRSEPFHTTNRNAMANVAIIGSGPTGIYTLAGLIESTTPLSVTVFEASADPGKGTPYHPRVNDKAMLANIASIEIPPICATLTDWLRSLSPTA